MITKEQASNAIQYLEAAAMNMTFEDEAHEIYNRHMRQGAVAILKDYIAQHEGQSNVKIVYEYKLRRADGLLLDRSVWSKKGKTYKNSGALKSALGHIINAAIEVDPNRPKFNYLIRFEGMSKVEIDAYHERYSQHTVDSQIWRENTLKREVRAEYIPEDWTVIAIAVNTNKPLQEMSAREWYSNQVEESA